MNSRNLVIIGSVVLFHLAALWALHTGLLKLACPCDVVLLIKASLDLHQSQNLLTSLGSSNQRINNR